MGVKWSMLDTQLENEVTRTHTFQPQLLHTKPKSRHSKTFSRFMFTDHVKPKSNFITPTSAKSFEDGDLSRFPNMLPCYIMKPRTPHIQNSLFVNLNVGDIPPEQLSILEKIKISVERARYSMTHTAVQHSEEQTNQATLGTLDQIFRNERANISPIHSKPISEPMPKVNFNTSPSNAKELFQNALKKAAPPPLKKVTIPMFNPIVSTKQKQFLGFKSVAPPSPSKVSVLAQ